MYGRHDVAAQAEYLLGHIRPLEGTHAIVSSSFIPPFLTSDALVWDRSITLHLGSLLEAASFETPVCRSYISPLGRLCRHYNGADGGSLASEEEFTLSGSEILFGSLIQAAFERGVLEAPRGTRITTEEGRDELLEEIIDGLREEGGCTVWSEFVARKL